MSVETICSRFFEKSKPDTPQNWEIFRDRFAVCQSADELFNIVIELTESCACCGYDVEVCTDEETCNGGILKFLKQEAK